MLRWGHSCGRLTSFASRIEALECHTESADQADDTRRLEHQEDNNEHAIENGAEIATRDPRRGGALRQNREGIERDRDGEDEGRTEDGSPDAATPPIRIAATNWMEKTRFQVPGVAMPESEA